MNIPTEITLNGTSLLYAGIACHFVAAAFMHYRWVFRTNKYATERNNGRKGKDRCFGDCKLDPVDAVVRGLYRFVIGPEAKLLELVAYGAVKTLGILATGSNVKPWKVNLHAHASKSIAKYKG